MKRLSSLPLPKTDALIEQLRRVSSGRSNKHPEAPVLSLQELGALVIAAGTEAGFVVVVEKPVKIKVKSAKKSAKKSEEPRQGRLDCCWCVIDQVLRPGNPVGGISPLRTVVAWEFDGNDVAGAHVARSDGQGRIGTIDKLCASRAPIKRQAFYAFREGKVLGKSEAARKELRKSRIPYVTAQELLDGKLRHIVESALAVARRRQFELLPHPARAR
jgi:hypothetical protein